MYAKWPALAKACALGVLFIFFGTRA